MSDIQTLLDLEAIKRLKGRYCIGVDTQDKELFFSVFTEDAVLEFEFATPWAGEHKQKSLRLEGREGLDQFWSSTGVTMHSVHHCHTPVIDILSPTEAKGIWAMEDIIEYPDNVIHGFGHYHETYRKVDGEWYIASLHLTRLRMSQYLKGSMNL